MAAMRIDINNFEQEVMASEKTVLLDFFAPWCGPCQMLGPVVDALAEELTNVKVAKVNVDEERELAKRYRVFSVPTLVVIKDGQVAHRAVGAVSREEILEML